jgi:hypothetical protein
MVIEHLHVLPFSARHCCFYCLATKQEMQEDPATRPAAAARTLEQINEHYNDFVNQGATRSKAKSVSYNVIAKPITTIPIEQVTKTNINCHDLMLIDLSSNI